MAGNTPKQRYPQPFQAEGDIYPSEAKGAMASSPRVTGGIISPYQTTPLANPAAVRAYTRNAPYMEEFMSDPQTIVSEMYRLQKDLKENPNDPVSEYRFRILRQALGDVFGMQAPEELDALGVNHPSAPATPSTTYGGAVTPKYRY